MKKVMFALAAIATTGVATGLATSPAMAQDLPTETIETAAYNLDSEAGYEAVANQIRRAAGRVCGNVDQRNLALAQSWQACRSVAIADGMEQLDAATRAGSVTVVASR